MPYPERRREPRLRADMEVMVTVLDPPGEPVTARVVEISGSGLLLRLTPPPPVDAPLRIAGGDFLLLGEVCRCEAGQVAVRVHHSLNGLAELDRLNRRLLGADRGGGPGPAGSVEQLVEKLKI